MSVNIATMGMFKDCCGRAVGGGGAPPYRRDQEKVLPRVLVKKVEVTDIDLIESLLDKIKVTLVDD
jgi:hypothetical protein